MAHRIEFFTANCPLCRRFRTEVELGKCAGCRMDVIDVQDPQAAARVRAYDVRVVPTVVIDGRIKVEGRLDEPWQCGDDFYDELRKRYPLDAPQDP